MDKTVTYTTVRPGSLGLKGTNTLTIRTANVIAKEKYFIRLDSVKFPASVSCLTTEEKWFGNFSIKFNFFHFSRK